MWHVHWQAPAAEPPGADPALRQLAGHGRPLDAELGGGLPARPHGDLGPRVLQDRPALQVLRHADAGHGVEAPEHGGGVPAEARRRPEGAEQAGFQVARPRRQQEPQQEQGQGPGERPLRHPRAQEQRRGRAGDGALPLLQGRDARPHGGRHPQALGRPQGGARSSGQGSRHTERGVEPPRDWGPHRRVGLSGDRGIELAL
mmetsp:Transcript_107493/g.336248  ORF Transcript_107493/g.336248 Transcript_107493/m.336248 type:complete len:201 (-) Transcript_107493:724-1326(-)